MISVIGQDIEAVGYFTATKQGKTGLTVTCDVYDQANTKIKNGVAATEIGGGLYQYTLPAADFDARGNYKFIFKTADSTVDVQHVPAMWTGVGNTILDESGTGGELTDSLTGLLRALRIRLNDLDIGNYTTEELTYCINLAYRESVVAAKCHTLRKTIALVEGTPTYDCAEIFEPIDITLAGVTLTHKNVNDITLSVPGWDTTANGTPTTWIHLTGGSIRLYPTPGATPGTLTVYGYARPTVLSAGTDVATALPEAYRVSCILDRAEAEARKMRITTSNNAGLYNSLMDSWKALCLDAANALDGDA